MKSKRQRAKIYLDAALRIFDSDNTYCCCAIRDIIAPNTYDESIVNEQLFPEFYLFKPEAIDTDGSWWKTNTDNQEERILTLLFAKAIAETKTKIR